MGASKQQMILLEQSIIALLRRKPCTVKELSEALNVANTTLQRYVRRLVNEGHIELRGHRAGARLYTAAEEVPELLRTMLTGTPVPAPIQPTEEVSASGKIRRLINKIADVAAELEMAIGEFEAEERHIARLKATLKELGI